MKTVEKSNWSGRGIVCPRPRFAEVKLAPEFNGPAVYLLLGPSDTPDIPWAYVGEADPIRARLEKHNATSDFWTVAYFFVSKDGALNKAHVQYLESRLLTLAKEAKRCTLVNTNSASLPSLSAADIADVETYLDEMLLCFPVLGVTVFERPSELKVKRMLYLTNKGVSAEGYEADDGFVAVAKSTVVIEAVASTPSYVKALRAQLLSNGTLVPKDESYYQLAQDYKFSSPSTAAAFLVGANISGRENWKDKQGRSLNALQAPNQRIQE